MIKFLKRHWISISLLIISSIIGFVVLMRETPVDIWRIEYEFNADFESELPPLAKADTVIEYRNIICRNLSSSISDTLINKGIRRQELKIYVPRPSKEIAMGFGEDLFESEEIRIINHRFQETQRNKRGLLNWVLFGFFLGIVVEFIIALKKKPRAN